jgi:hypothetical protein
MVTTNESSAQISGNTPYKYFTYILEYACVAYVTKTFESIILEIYNSSVYWTKF